MGEQVVFWVLAPVMTVAAGGLLFARKAVHAALSMVLVMVGLAFAYVAQDAPFLGIVQVVVYTGAVMMLFLFVLMLVGVDAADTRRETLPGQGAAAWVGGVGLLVVLVGALGRVAFGDVPAPDDAAAVSNPAGVARLVFGEYVLAFEAVGTLLVTAAVGAIVLTHRERFTPKRGQKERAEARVKALGAGAVLTPPPAPGVYARHNAMDVPALDWQGEPIEASVSRVLRVRGQQADQEDYAARYPQAAQAAAERRREARALEAARAEARAAQDAAGPGTTASGTTSSGTTEEVAR